MKKLFCLFLIVFLVFSLAGCKKEVKEETSQKGIGENEAMADTSKSNASADTVKAKVPADTSEKIVREKNPIVVIETDFGNIELELFWNKTPKHALNFLRLVHQGFYDGLIFHRVIPGFVVQGGDPKGDGTGDPGYSIPFEQADTKHLRGSLGMARGPQDLNSAGCQFYICLKDLPSLDGNYVVFGKTVKGMEAVDKIAQVKTAPDDKPLEKVVMKKVYEKIEEKK